MQQPIKKKDAFIRTSAKQAASANVPMVTQVRIAANIANGIKHAFKEFQASEIVMGLHAQTSYIEGVLGTIYTEPLQWFEPPNYNSSYCATIEYIRRYKLLCLRELSLNLAFIVGWNE